MITGKIYNTQETRNQIRRSKKPWTKAEINQVSVILVVCVCAFVKLMGWV